MKLSTCLVLKNEGETIYRALDSVKEVTDEYIIGIDTKTTDNTKTEVERFFKNNKGINRDIYEYEFKDSFSGARNEGMDKASGDWILILDGHEFFPSTWKNIVTGTNVDAVACLKEVKKQVGEENPDTDELFFCLYQQPFVGEVPNNFFMQPRMYRNGKSKLIKDGKDYTGEIMRFGRKAHNVMKFTRPELSIQYPEVILIHDAPDSNRKERKAQRLDMNTRELKADLKKNSKDVRALFYLGNTLLEAKDYKGSIDSFDKYISLNKLEHSEKYQAYLHKALAHKETKEEREWKNSIFEAIKIDPSRRDAFILMGDFYQEVKDYQKAIFYYSTALMIAAKHDYRRDYAV